MRDRNLQAILESFTVDAAAALAAETAGGAEIPFEVIEAEGRRGRAPLYCYRPLTASFIEDRITLLSCLPSYSAAVRAVASFERAGEYLIQRGQGRLASDPRQRADEVLMAFLRRVFDERSQFGFDPARFEIAYGELELALFEGRRTETVIAPVLGVAFDPSTPEITLSEGLSLVRGDRLDDAPDEAVWGDGEEPHVLIVLTVSEETSTRSALSLARSRFRRVLTALRLFERGGYALGPLAWTRADGGTWRSVPLGTTGRPRMLTMIPARQEDELRAFCNLVARRAPTSGEIAWALARFEMGCERMVPFEALTDHLLGLRALLEPEGPSTGRLAQRLAVLCARPEDRASLAERTARAISLERAVIAGLASAERSAGADVLVSEIAEHLRALLRDVICGHLDADLIGVADQILDEAVRADPGREAEPPDHDRDAASTDWLEYDDDFPEPGAYEDDHPEPGEYPWPQAAPYSAPQGAGSVMPARPDT